MAEELGFPFFLGRTALRDVPGLAAEVRLVWRLLRSSALGLEGMCERRDLPK